jgi:2-aminoadipate transaminase
MNWNQHFADATTNLRRNTVREFLKYAKRPGMISFGGGLPAPELFPIAEFAKASDAVLRRHGAKALQYGESEGVAELREWIAADLGVAAENVLITSGAQQALDLLGRVLIDKDDHVAVENPTYLALLSSWRLQAPKFEAVRSDAEGLCVDGLRAGAKLLYLVPNFQNPQGTTLTLERRVELAEFARQQELIVVEDDPYGELRYDGEALPSVFEFAGKTDGPVVRVGTFSKVLAPGLRVGWLIADRALLEKVVQAKQSSDLHTSTFNQYLALELVANGLLDTQIPKLCSEYRHRRDVMLESLSETMPEGVEWTTPEGGMFLLITLPAGVNGAEIARAALSENVLVVPGEDFHVIGGENTLRLNFSNCTPEQIKTGIGRLAGIVAGRRPFGVHMEGVPTAADKAVRAPNVQ